ncbi:MAG: translation initiation factor IF-2 [Candidatus Diapherotrites archaeon]
MIRKPIIAVLGHVDSGKTSFLDRIRGTTIAAQEAGAITQHIGATEVPIEIIKELSQDLLKKYHFSLTIPGLLFIDTPGHEAFTNLRKRGGSIADLAVLIIDIQKGIEQQTAEAIEILKAYKVPFIAGLTKIDKLQHWNSKEGTFTANLKEQSEEAKEELDQKLYGIVGQLHSKGFNSERFDRVKELTKEIPIVPLCNKTGEGIPEILMFLAGLSQKYLEKKLSIHVTGPGKGTILEVKDEKGLGKTIDVILYDGTIRTGQEIAVGGKNGAIKTKIRALLLPKPLDEIRSPQEKFDSVKEVHAAAGLKIAAPNLEEAIAGAPLRVIEKDTDLEEVQKEIKSIEIESDDTGPILKTDALGSLEAIIKLLEKHDLKVRKASVGEVTRKDIIEMECMKEKDENKCVIIAFNTKINPEAEAEAEKRGVKIFKENIVYKLIEEYEKWIKEQQEKEKRKALEGIMLPAKIKILPSFVFRNSKPAIVGVKVLEGKLVTGVKLMRKGKNIGKVDAIQMQGENRKEAEKGSEVAISIDGAVVGRTIKEKDELLTSIPESHMKRLEEYGSLGEEEKKLIEEIRKYHPKKE